MHVYRPNLVGIDTGGHGAMTYTTSSGLLFSIRFSQHSEADLLDIIYNICTKKTVYYERLTGYQSDKYKIISHKLFTMGDNHGIVRAAAILGAGEGNVIPIHSGAWQASFSTIRRGLEYNEHKRDMWQVAKKVFPQIAFHKEEADAMLIWNYGMRMETLKE